MVRAAGCRTGTVLYAFRSPAEPQLPDVSSSASVSLINDSFSRKTEDSLGRDKYFFPRCPGSRPVAIGKSDREAATAVRQRVRARPNEQSSRNHARERVRSCLNHKLRNTFNCGGIADPSIAANKFPGTRRYRKQKKRNVNRVEPLERCGRFEATIDGPSTVNFHE